jgi:WD40 repeat protein
VHVWDVAQRRLVGPRITLADWVQFATFSPDGRRLVYSTETAPPALWIEGAEGEGAEFGEQDIHAAAFAPQQDLLITTARDRTASLWHLDGNAPPAKLIDLEASTQVSAVAFSPDGRTIATGADDGTIRLWDTRGNLLAELRAHQSGVSRLTFSADGRRLASASEDWTARVYELSAFPRFQMLGIGDSLVWLASLDPASGRLFFSTEAGTAYLVDGEGPARLLPLDHERVPRMTCAGLDAGAHLLATPYEEGEVRLFALDQPSDPPKRLVHEATNRVRCVAFRPSARELATTFGATIHLWPLDGGAKRILAAPLVDPEPYFQSVAWSRDGRWLIGAGADASAWVWPADGGAGRALKGHRLGLMNAALSDDGARAITASLDRTARVWDVAAGSSVVLEGHRDAVWSADLNRDGTLALTGGRDGRVILWDAETGQKLASLDGNADGVALATFVDDDRTVLAVGRRGLVRRWDVSLESRPYEAVRSAAARFLDR